MVPEIQGFAWLSSTTLGLNMVLFHCIASSDILSEHRIERATQKIGVTLQVRKELGTRSRGATRCRLGQGPGWNAMR
jgi:hypothetical protein